MTATWPLFPPCHISSSWVNKWLHTKNKLQKLPGFNFDLILSLMSKTLNIVFKKTCNSIYDIDAITCFFSPRISWNIRFGVLVSLLEEFAIWNKLANMRKKGVFSKVYADGSQLILLLLVFLNIRLQIRNERIIWSKLLYIPFWFSEVVMNVNVWAL